MDWRILNAVNIDMENRTFLPAGSRRYKPLLFLPADRVLPISLEKIKEMHEGVDDYLGDNTVNLSTEYREGRLKPYYSHHQNPVERVQRGEERKPMVDNKINIFRYAGNGVTLGINADLLIYFTEVGLDVCFCYEKKGSTPLLGAADFDQGIFAVIAPIAVRDVSRTPAGARMEHSADDVCWMSIEQALTGIKNWIGPFHPGYYDQETVISDILETNFQKQNESVRHPGVEVDVLRWNGVPDEEIAELLAEVQGEAWPRIYEQVLSEVSTLCDLLLEHTDRGTSKYHLTSWERQIQRIIKSFKSLEELMDTPLDNQPLIELVELYEEIKDQE